MLFLAFYRRIVILQLYSPPPPPTPTQAPEEEAGGGGAGDRPRHLGLRHLHELRRALSGARHLRVPQRGGAL